MNIYWKSGLALALVIVGFVGGCSMKQHQLDKIQQDYAEQVNQALQTNRELEQKMQSETNAIAVQYQQEKAVTDKTIEQLKKDLTDAKKNHPLPDTCRLDADRMRIIKAAVDTANHSRP